MSFVRAGLAIVLTAGLAACGGGSSSSPSSQIPADVHVIDATATPLGKRAALLSFAAHNAGGSTDRLLGVTCDCGGAATILQDGTTPVDEVAIASEETHIFGPGGDTVELRGLTAPLATGAFVGLTLDFDLAGHVEVDAVVQAAKS
jgi:copper(I)-binding protein